MTFKKLADRARLKLEAAEADDLFGALVGAPASEQLVGRDDLEVYVLEVASFRRVRVLERGDLHGGDGHARLAARKDLAPVRRERHATAQHAERPAARLLVRAPALAEADDRAARALQLVRRVSDARRDRARLAAHLGGSPPRERAQARRQLAHPAAQRALEADESVALLFERVTDVRAVQHKGREP